MIKGQKPENTTFLLSKYILCKCFRKYSNIFLKIPWSGEREYQEQYKNNEEQYWSHWDGMFMLKFSRICKVLEHTLLLKRVRKSKLFWLDLTHVKDEDGGRESDWNIPQMTVRGIKIIP